MNWDKAKNIAIFFLLLLNAGLAALIYHEKQSDTLPVESERAIYRLLAQNKIGFYADIVKKSTPMRQLTLQPAEFDLEELRSIFIQGENTKRTNEFDKTVLESEWERLTVQDGYLFYENTAHPVEGLPADETASTEICQIFFDRWGKEFKNFTLDQIQPQPDGYLISYCQNYRGSLIYSNYFQFYISKGQIRWIECHYSRPVKYEGVPRDIRFADEIIFTLINELKNLYGDDDHGLFISSMDLVFYQEEIGSYRESDLKATPYFRFYAADIPQPFLINAYNNTWLSWQDVPYYQS